MVVLRIIPPGLCNKLRYTKLVECILRSCSYFHNRLVCRKGHSAGRPLWLFGVAAYIIHERRSFVWLLRRRVTLGFAIVFFPLSLAREASGRISCETTAWDWDRPFSRCIGRCRRRERATLQQIRTRDRRRILHALSVPFPVHGVCRERYSKKS